MKTMHIYSAYALRKTLKNFEKLRKTLKNFINMVFGGQKSNRTNDRDF